MKKYQWLLYFMAPILLISLSMYAASLRVEANRAINNVATSSEAGENESEGGSRSMTNNTRDDMIKCIVSTIIKCETVDFLKLYVNDPSNVKINHIYKQNDTLYIADYNVSDKRYLCYIKLSNEKDNECEFSWDNTEVKFEDTKLKGLLDYTNFKITDYSLRVLDLDKLERIITNDKFYTSTDGYKVKLHKVIDW